MRFLGPPRTTTLREGVCLEPRSSSRGERALLLDEESSTSLSCRTLAGRTGTAPERTWCGDETPIRDVSVVTRDGGSDVRGVAGGYAGVPAVEDRLSSRHPPCTDASWVPGPPRLESESSLDAKRGGTPSPSCRRPRSCPRLPVWFSVVR